MSKIKNGGLDQYGAERFEQQQCETSGVEGVNYLAWLLIHRILCSLINDIIIIARMLTLWWLFNV